MLISDKQQIPIHRSNAEAASKLLLFLPLPLSNVFHLSNRYNLKRDTTDECNCTTRSEVSYDRFGSVASI